VLAALVLPLLVSTLTPLPAASAATTFLRSSRR
jgi:hypothetical protein